VNNTWNLSIRESKDLSTIPISTFHVAFSHLKAARKVKMDYCGWVSAPIMGGEWGERCDPPRILKKYNLSFGNYTEMSACQ